MKLPFQIVETKNFICPARLAGGGATNRTELASNGCRFGQLRPRRICAPKHSVVAMRDKNSVFWVQIEHGRIVNDAFTRL
jgi:hypothetical protein